ncbi:MAG TPA: diguanylate cyclase [Steroidobacteraceae bacterium]|nr:diguanylate cyclase [Steroidobacteraceae bacterium]
MTPGYETNLSAAGSRGQLDEFAAGRWQAAIDAGASLALLLIGVDDCRRYYDCYGPEAGDALLRQVAQAVDRCRGRCLEPAARLRDDELMLLLPDPQAGRLRAAAERVLQAVRELEIPHRGSTVANYVTVSVGAASCSPRGGDCPAAVVDAAAGALWAAKRRGGDRVEIRDLDALARQNFQLRLAAG